MKELYSTESPLLSVQCTA